jgi:hypothetical protein
MRTLLQRCENAWCDDLHVEQTNVLNWKQTASKPSLSSFRQFGHTLFAGSRRTRSSSFSAIGVG